MQKVPCSFDVVMLRRAVLDAGILAQRGVPRRVLGFLGLLHVLTGGGLVVNCPLRPNLLQVDQLQQLVGESGDPLGCEAVLQCDV